MAVIVRIDADRPYGKHPVLRHAFSRLSSDLYFPRVELFGYLRELKTVLQMLNERSARAYVFFRRCTLPSPSVLLMIREGRHGIGLQLENSRSYETFERERQVLEQHVGDRVAALSKHGSGGARYGLHHFAPYEPDKYVKWAKRSGMRVFLGNLEDPSLGPTDDNDGFHAYPAAFWLEPHWRDTTTFTLDWLLTEGKNRDIVLLAHPDNMLADANLVGAFRVVIDNLPTKVIT